MRIQKIVYALLLSSVYSFSSYALPLMMSRPSLPELLPSPNKKTTSKADPTQCTDFTGKWKGSCTYEVNGKSMVFDQDIKIAQSECSWMDFGDAHIRIGSNGTQDNRFDKDLFSTSTVYFFWSNNQSNLTFKIFENAKHNNSNDSAFDLSNSETTANMYIDHEQKLKYQASFVTYIETDLGGDKKSEHVKFVGKMACSFDVEK